MTKEDKILQILEEHSKLLLEHSKTLNEHTKILNEHTKILNEHTKKLSEHDNNFDGIYKHLDNIDKTLDSINKALVIIEDDTHNKIPALFDAHYANKDHLERNDKAIEDLQEKSENHAIRIISPEMDSRHYSKQLNKLTSSK